MSEQQQQETFHCPTCGKDICALSATVHRATCGTRRHHRVAQQQAENQHRPLPNATTTVAAAAATTSRGEEEQQQHTQHDDDDSFLRQDQEASQQAPSPAEATTSLDPRPPHDWACPQCTLLNDVTRLYCEACGHLNTTSQQRNHTNDTTTRRRQAQPRQQAQQQASSTSRVTMEIREINPRTVAAATTAVSIASWTVLGGLIAGPVGAAVGGFGATLLAATSSQSRRRQQPAFSFTSTTVTGNHVTTTRYVTANNSSGRAGRTVVLMRSAPPGSSDRLLRRMLLLQGMQQAVIDGMDYDQLVEQFRALGEDDENHRGATAEAIAALPCTHIPDDQAAAKWSEKPCNICLEDFAAHEDLRQLPACGHAFHKDCIDEWLQRVALCPICKKDISSDATTTQTTRDSGANAGNTQEA